MWKGKIMLVVVVVCVYKDWCRDKAEDGSSSSDMILPMGPQRYRLISRRV